MFKYPFDEFVAYRNFENCEFAVLEKNESTNRLEFRYCVRGFEEAGAAVKGDRLCFKKKLYSNFCLIFGKLFGSFSAVSKPKFASK